MQDERKLNTCDDLRVRFARALYESVNVKSVKLSDLERFDGCSESDQIFTSKKKKIDTPSLDKKRSACTYPVDKLERTQRTSVLCRLSRKMRRVIMS